MTPKTKIQKKVVELSAKLPAITPKHEEWAKVNLFDKYVVRSRRTLFCMECGHSWRDESQLITTLTGCTCQACNQQLKLKDVYKPAFTDRTYFAILSVKENMQVVRMFVASKHVQKMKYPYWYVKEVMQHWIDSAGNVTSMAKNTTGLSGIADAWVWNSELTVKPKYYQNGQQFSISPYRIYPGAKLIPDIKRNGFKGNYHGYSPHDFFITILSNPKAETLLKAGQIDLFKSVESCKFKYGKYWPLIKICIRNNYKVKDPSLWFDHLDMLRDTGKDLHNSKYICPTNLNADHNRLIMNKRQQDKKIRIEKMRERLEYEQIKYAEQKGKFFDLAFGDSDITIKTLETVEEFMNEGDTLSHCVFSNEYYKNSDSLIMSARINNVPIETIEVSLKKMEVIQSRGMKNKATEYHDRILGLVRSNMNILQKVYNE